MSVTILRLPQVKAKSGLSRSSIYEGVRNNTFPAPIHLSERTVGWIESEIDQWIEERIKASRRRSA